MRRLSCKRITVRLAALIVGVFGAHVASAQTVITGRVTNEQGAPIAGANVSIPSLAIRAQTDATGTYRVTVPADRATGQTVSISGRYIGFTQQAQAVTLSPGSQTVNFTLTADPFNLGEVVVTGVATGTEQRKLPFTVSKVTEEQISQVPAASPVTALEGKVAGAHVSVGSGAPGAPPAIRLRGSTNLALGGSEPLIIVDGVVTRSNISDLDANDIESVEVLKGATASSYYGSNAANGVINITTKRGRSLPEGTVQVISRSEYGKSGIQHWVPLNTSHPYLLNPDGEIFLNAGGARVTTSQFMDQPYPTTGPHRWRNQLQEWMKNGEFYSSNEQVGLRRGSTNFAASFTSDHNSGVIPLLKGQYRQNARVNVDQGVGDKLDMSLSMTYGTVKNDARAGETLSGALTGNNWFSLLQAPPDINLRTPWNDPTGKDTTAYWRQLPPVASPSARDNPLYSLAYEDYTIQRDRFIGSASARYRPLSWLNFDANYGTDRLAGRERTYDFKGYQTETGTPGNGFLSRNARNDNSWNGQVAGTAIGRLFNAINTTTRVASIYEQRKGNYFTASTSRLTVLKVPDLDAGDPTQVSISSDDQLERNVNYLASQTLDIKDRYIIDAMIRRDGSSLFGSANRWKNFYRVSGAWRVSEDIHLPGVQEFKLRGGRGTAGLRPGYFDQYETYSVNSGSISKSQVGNKDLRPAVATEDEFGLNLAFLERFNLELVQANRITRGAFLRIPLSLAQSGGFTSQVQNAADVSARTTELSLETQVFTRPNMSYSFTLTGDHTKQRIDHLGRAPFRVEGLGQGQDMFYYKEGEPLGIMYGVQWVRTFAQLKENPANAAAVETDYTTNALGYLVKTATPGALIKYVDATGADQHVIGNVNPKFSWGLANNFHFRSFNVYALFDGQHGGDIYNFTKQWMFQDLRHGDMDMRGKPDDQKVPFSVFTQSLYNGLLASDYFVEDGSYVKLRELSVAYNVGERVFRATGLNRFANGMKLALIGRNLYTWTKYSGFDPDVTAGSDFNFRVDGFRYPNFRTLTGQVELTF
ncbi:MAG TPA: SusC/RagA family TonB-linked outer membrane protein [Gemmatimonadaceae bacterium]|nr:SusC/RagA family TonB-linked outer membrane protein [Gemmatimonadaceae bacterium]